jgi:RNA polymerase sigma-70 factor (ECF subfamily)
MLELVYRNDGTTELERPDGVDLVTYALEGDDLAWEALVEDHQEAVFRLAYLLIGNADDAEDIAQETFIAAYKALHTFDRSRPLRPWLLSIAANRARNTYRSVSRYSAAIGRFAKTLSGTAASAEAISTRNDEERSLWKAIQRLKHEDQQIIYLRYFLELSVPDTADTLDIAPGTVKSRLHRALERLKIIIEREYPHLRTFSGALELGGES